MKTIKKVPVTFQFSEGSKSLPEHSDMEESVIYVSREHGCALHKCLCGCGEVAAMSLKPAWKDGWDLIDEKNGTHSFTPSILNTNCPNKSHYIISKNIANFV